MTIQLSQEQCDKIYALAESLTGASQQGRFRKEIIITNVLRRMQEVRISDLDEYLRLATINQVEISHLTHACTIHTTSWFREPQHFEELEKHAIKHALEKPKELYQVWCSASSTGEEAYSIALVLNAVRMRNQDFDYMVMATDIDPISVQKVRDCIYNVEAIENIPSQYRGMVFVGNAKTKGLMTLDPEIRNRVRSEVYKLSHEQGIKFGQFHVIFCRNVLIYFNEASAKSIVKGLLSSLNVGGLLCLGHSELGLVPQSDDFLSLKGNSIIRKPMQKNTGNPLVTSLRVLIIDDSATVRKVLRKQIESFGYIVHEASSAMEADAVLKTVQPDLITLDLNMDKVNGVTWLKSYRLINQKTPVMIISDSNIHDAESIFGALENGAQDYVLKSQISINGTDFKDRINELIQSSAQKAYGTKQIQNTDYVKVLGTKTPDLILIGASTGGPEALQLLLQDIAHEGVDLPPIMVVQHIHSFFARAFAERLSKISGLTLCECAPNEKLKRNYLYMNLVDAHVGVTIHNAEPSLKVSTEAAVSGHRPSVDYLFKSASETNLSSIAIVLTGMGRDGSKGMKALKDRGLSYCMAQDAESSVVYGMPAEVAKLKLTDHIGNIRDIRFQLNKILGSKKNKLTAA